VIDPSVVARAAAVLRRGGLVAFPTETVYGLGADATSERAIERLYVVKGRPPTHPLIVHLGDASWLDDWTVDVPEEARRLTASFWPGPLTLILRRSSRVPLAVTGGQDTVGVRVPRHPLALALLREFGSAVAAPSANRFGRISPTTAAHVVADLDGDVDLVLDGGPCEVGIESTIVDLSRGRPVVLRPGGIPPDRIAQVAGVPVANPAGSRMPRAPGTLDAHYAPRTPLVLLEPDALHARPDAPGSIAVLAFEPPSWLQSGDVIQRASADAASYAHDLYATLRELDAGGASLIVVAAPPASAEWSAVRDRLRRAARGRHV
jgi:L-threonylcarbamoyladenylate synthase